MIKEFFARFDAPLKLFLIVGIVVLSGFLFLDSRREESQVLVREQPFEIVGRCGQECEKKITEIVSRAIATISAKPTQRVEAPKTAVSSKSQIEYVPVGGTGSTTQRDWADLLNTDFFLDIGEYGRTREIRWTATSKVKDGNGQAFARLFDVTHGVGVQGSEISTTSQNFTLVESGILTFHFSGKNRYRVQVKSLTGYEAFFDSGRIKIVTE